MLLLVESQFKQPRLHCRMHKPFLSENPLLQLKHTVELEGEQVAQLP